MKSKILLLGVLYCNSFRVFACTSFGYITPTGTVIAKNSDFYYDVQSVKILAPNKQFALWYDNNDGNNFKIFAQMANNNVKMGVNEAGLTAVEEDPLLPKDRNHRRYMQPVGGSAECMTMWGILQNFRTVDEILPFINDIFSRASPNHYEIADNRKILIVEVGYGIDDKATTRPFSYKVLDKPTESYTHTNTYQDPKFLGLNNLASNPYAVIGAHARNNGMKVLLKSADKSESVVLSWLLNTNSQANNPSDNKWCLGTSIFRSNIGNKRQMDNNILHSDTYGTVASMIVFNNGTAEKTKVIIRIIDTISVDAKGNQTITYKELQSSLKDLFEQKYVYNKKQFKRAAPVSGVCK